MHAQPRRTLEVAPVLGVERAKLRIVGRPRVGLRVDRVDHRGDQVRAHAPIVPRKPELQRPLHEQLLVDHPVQYVPALRRVGVRGVRLELALIRLGEQGHTVHAGDDSPTGRLR